eukprot:TRINITY_DN8842_c0_g1_i4.p2 TRINITY_DN8842_c0_g1~~TRINITY_DN8842_c0_g1_i4.p2  ORF type:complete len:245 (+),score=43.25 TRINITY_DN8842_c0_g1_i4:965-1699(+)
MSRLSADRGGPCDIEVYEYTDVVPWYKRRIFLMYEHYSRGRLSSLPAIFSDNAAHLDQVLRILVQKYGPEPGRDPPPLIDYHGRLSCIAADYPIGDTPALLREWCGREELLILNIRWQHHFQEITVAPFVVADADTWGRLRRIYWRWRPDFVAAEDAWRHLQRRFGHCPKALLAACQEKYGEPGRCSKSGPADPATFAAAVSQWLGLYLPGPWEGIEDLRETHRGFVAQCLLCLHERFSVPDPR